MRKWACQHDEKESKAPPVVMTLVETVPAGVAGLVTFDDTG
tara:strand:- start:1940 stop:2062 length:123 start_codon:yes stop_codon:yes gene_type:complete